MTLRGNFSFSLKLLLAKTNMRIKSSITTTTTINYIINSISISRTQPQAFFGFIHINRNTRQLNRKTFLAQTIQNIITSNLFLDFERTFVDSRNGYNTTCLISTHYFHVVNLKINIKSYLFYFILEKQKNTYLRFFLHYAIILKEKKFIEIFQNIIFWKS